MTDVISDHALRYARSRRHYIVACVALLLLLATSAALGRVHMGIGNLIAGVGIAVVKAAIVAWIFMSLREASPLTRIVTIVDIYDALRSRRTYKEAFSIDVSFKIMWEEAEKGWWDKDVLAHWEKLIRSKNT